MQWNSHMGLLNVKQAEFDSVNSKDKIWRLPFAIAKNKNANWKVGNDYIIDNKGIETIW